ncbi:MAG TPA: glycosyltransferase family 4 protein [Candidatus Aquilonibacter sp.]|nr:glycosyltransferase family 4 protein [Candidatus Aquilonibacter sp.]
MRNHAGTVAKVVHLTSVHPPFDVRIFHKECRSIARAGYDITLIAPHVRDEIIEGVRLKAIASPSGRLDRMVRGAWRVCREALRQDADLFHFHDPELMPVGLLLRLKGKIVVYDAHEDVLADVAFKHYIPKTLQRPLARLINLFENLSSRCFSARVAATEPIGRRFVFRTGRTVVISNYPSSENESFAPAKPWAERSTSVAYVGVLSADRCIHEIVRAMTLLPKHSPVTLNLAGTFSPARLREQITGRDGWEHVRLHGKIGRPQIAQLLSDVRAGLVVVRPEPNYMECAPNKLFEYMQAGIPVIASDFPGFRRIVNETRCGLLVNPLDPREIADSIAYLVNHPEEAEQMGLRGREAVKARLNWASEERKLLDLYDWLFESRGPVRAQGRRARGSESGRGTEFKAGT